ncbi:reverse transcriptase domain-containing protein [Tanacetum coccineum]
MQGVSKTDFENYVKANDAVLRNMQNQGQGLQNQMTNLTEMPSKFITSNTASSSNSGTLPSQTFTRTLKVPEISYSCALQELDRTNALADSGASINLLPHSIYKQLGLGAFKPTRMTLELANHSVTHPIGPEIGSDELVFYAEKSEKSKNKQFASMTISVIDFSKDEPFSGSTTNHSDVLPPSSSPMKTSENLEEFTDELTLLKKDSDEPVLLNTPLSDKVECSDPEDDIDEIDAFLAMEVSSNFEEGYFDSEGDFAGELITLPSRIAREHEDYLSRMTLLCEISTSRSQENVHANPSSIIESLPVSLIPVEDSDPVQEEIDIFLIPDDLIPPGVENDDSKDEDNELPNLDHQDNPSSPRPPPEPPDVCLNFKPDTAMKNDEDFNQREIVLSLNVEDVNSFTFVIWTFLPFFSYPEDSPVILSLRSEDFIFDPGISTFHFSLKPVPFALPKDK